MAGFLCEFQGSELRASSCVVRLLLIIPSYTGLRSRSEVLSILALVFIYLGGGWFWGNKAGVPSKTSHKGWGTWRLRRKKDERVKTGFSLACGSYGSSHSWRWFHMYLYQNYVESSDGKSWPSTWYTWEEGFSIAESPSSDVGGAVAGYLSKLWRWVTVYHACLWHLTGLMKSRMVNN